MHGIANIALHSVAIAPQGGIGPPPANPSGATFQLPSFPNPGSLSPAQGMSSSGSPALGSQTLSALLQTQDLTQTQGHGHGGGGGHHGGLKMMPNLAAEEAVESESAQILRQRKKLAKTIKTDKTSEEAEVDENGVVVTKDDAESATDEEEGEEDTLGSS